MALEHIEGWDEFANADIALRYGGNVNVISSSGRVAGKCVSIGNQDLIMAVPANARYTVGFAFQMNSVATTIELCRLREGTTVHGLVEFVTGSNAIRISRNGSIPATSGALAIVANVWYYLEIDYTVNDSTGAWEVRLNEVPIIGPTGSLDTRNAGTSGVIDNFYVTNQGTTRLYDDMYFASGSTSFQGDCRVVTSWPTSDSAAGNTGWTASSGSDFQCVDDTTQNGDTDYISSSSAGQKDTFGMTALGVTGTIRALAIAIWGRKDDAAARSVNAVVRRSGTDYDNATAHTLSTTTAGYQAAPWTVDPSTSSAWLVADIDAGEYGVKNV